MKLLLENWKKYLLKEQTELWGYDIRPNQKVFVAKEPFTGFRNVQQDTPESKWEKPQGLWYGCGDAWIKWLGWEQRDWLEASRYLYEIKPAGKILQISNSDEFNKLESDFGFHAGDGAIGGVGIDWKKMQDAGFAGIEICPYMGRSYGWYAGWDVASGCIWDSSGIADVVLLAEQPEGWTAEDPYDDDE